MEAYELSSYDEAADRFALASNFFFPELDHLVGSVAKSRSDGVYVSTLWHQNTRNVITLDDQFAQWWLNLDLGFETTNGSDNDVKGWKLWHGGKINDSIAYVSETLRLPAEYLIPTEVGENVAMPPDLDAIKALCCLAKVWNEIDGKGLFTTTIYT